MTRLFRRLRNIWRRAFPPKPIRIPGKWPWVTPGHLPMGTVLVERSEYKIVADGHGGQITMFRKLPRRCQSPRPPRASRGGIG